MPPLMCPATASHLTGGIFVRDLGGQLGLAGNQVEPADGPRVVALLDVLDEVHHLVVAGDALRAELRVNRVLHAREVADRNQPGFEEGENTGVVSASADRSAFDGSVPVRRTMLEGEHPLALVFLDLGAVLASEAFELDDIEPAAGDEHAARV